MPFQYCKEAGTIHDLYHVGERHRPYLSGAAHMQTAADLRILRIQ